mmetsp:Transcript_43835/g.104186  ORF Transcript_43835/g.104186 Transcript_43835/m.104186 type:complete len:297 (-) Transcript_43835:101-991(-)|eukprot:CAMPEP_0180129834 /NCGR_PEP_ID=MMETSP0986-20121125/7532_1 /TAXON_ID=697907 /ORGANISM="non described non described, Strain CCMP2293" /LENGTH=296 /DNA_ID=CAMNT_0022069539 /DNA_START=48 /DNA_END=938 /DNA_ORIENTATION=+
MAEDKITSVLILGASGGFGTLFSQVLAKDGVQVRGISRKGTPRADATFSDYLSADPCNPNEEVLERVRNASVIIACVPPGPCIKALEALAPHMAAGALFTDVLSVKTQICEAYMGLKDKFPHVQLMSLHPMFAPADPAGWRGKNNAVIEITGGQRGQTLTKMIEGWGCACFTMESGQVHDKVTGAVQNATHAALLTFGLTLSKMGYDAELAHKISTPPHRAMIEVIQRMANINEPDTYWDIQTENPNADDIWQKLQESVAELHESVKNRDREKFVDIIAKFKQLGPQEEGGVPSAY